MRLHDLVKFPKGLLMRSRAKSLLFCVILLAHRLHKPASSSRSRRSPAGHTGAPERGWSRSSTNRTRSRRRSSPSTVVESVHRASPVLPRRATAGLPRARSRSTSPPNADRRSRPRSRTPRPPSSPPSTSRSRRLASRYARPTRSSTSLAPQESSPHAYRSPHRSGSTPNTIRPPRTAVSAPAGRVAPTDPRSHRAVRSSSTTSRRRPRVGSPRSSTARAAHASRAAGRGSSSTSTQKRVQRTERRNTPTRPPNSSASPSERSGERQGSC